VHLWIGVLAALEQRARSGGGEHVDVAMCDATAATDEYNTAMYGFQGALRRRYYSRHVFGYPQDIMPCADGHVVVIPGATGFPSPLAPDVMSPMALLLEDPELNTHPLFKSAGERMMRWREFDELAAPYFSTHGALEIVMTAQALRMPFAFVPDAADLLAPEHPVGEHLAARGFFARVAKPGGGEVAVPGAPFRMSATPLETAPAPALGEANGELLGATAGEAR
jgi:crotonobetainyl-CoA:carnitine CoA-transferase CaiB-like acyl-CoA transferase